MDFRNQLGSTGQSGTILFVLFIPSADRGGQPIDHDYWVTQALEVLGRYFRGATAFPRARGVWRDDEREARLVFEEPTIVQSYAEHEAVTNEAMAAVRSFLHRLGRETNQGEVGIVIDGEYFPIRNYDK
jgi:hypothetical protein